MRRLGLDKAGDPRWFYGLPRESQVDVLAILHIEAEDAEKAARRAGVP